MKYIARDTFLFFALMVVFFLGRLAVLLWFGYDKISFVTPEWNLLSIRYDLMTAAHLVFPTFLLSIFALFFNARKIYDRLKKIYAIFILGLSIFFAALNIAFFSEYKSQFNQWILGIFYDDFVAIMSTIFKTYPIFLILIAVFAIFAFAYFVVSYVFNKTANLPLSKRLSMKFAIITLIVFVFCLRGATLDKRELRPSDAIITDSAFLNNLIPNSAYCIWQELKTHFEFLSFDDSLKFFDSSEAEISELGEKFFGAKYPDINAALTFKAKGSPLSAAPSHIFLIIVESHSAWPLFDEYKDRNLLPETDKLLKKSLGTKFALPAGICTVDSVTSIVGGLPFAMLSAAAIPDYTDEFSIARPMNDFGYTTRFFTASSTNWCHIGNFVKKMGFDESLGGNMMDEEFFLHEWGVPDRNYFDYLSKYDFGEKSFNVILTVSNHPPYDVNLKAEGCPNEITDALENKVQHHWYADKSLGDFVRKMRERYPDALFVITGDHPARLNPPYLGEEFENRMCVPLMFVGAAIESENLVSELKYASHMDIAPTLVELIAPKDYEYKTWGNSLMSAARRYEPLNPYAIFYKGELQNPKSTNCPQEARQRQKAYMTLAYWRSVKGPNFPTTPKESNEN